MAVIFQVAVFWVVTPCNAVVVGYHRFRGPCCLHLQGEDSSRSVWVVIMCNVVVEYQRFKGPYCLHIQRWNPITMNHYNWTPQIRVGICYTSTNGNENFTVKSFGPLQTNHTNDKYFQHIFS
jgi:hypothetical protein